MQVDIQCSVSGLVYDVLIDRRPIHASLDAMPTGARMFQLRPILPSSTRGVCEILKIRPDQI